MAIEIIIRDDSGAKIAGFKVHAKDKKAIRKVLKTIKMAYNIDLSIKYDEKEKDLDWLK